MLTQCERDNCLAVAPLCRCRHGQLQSGATVFHNAHSFIVPWPRRSRGRAAPRRHGKTIIVPQHRTLSVAALNARLEAADTEGLTVT